MRRKYLENKIRGPQPIGYKYTKYIIKIWLKLIDLIVVQGVLYEHKLPEFLVKINNNLLWYYLRTSMHYRFIEVIVDDNYKKLEFK
ncbi:hypothetical protein ACFLQL_01600 [Verrucomicrobiota bacterium]